MTWFDFDSLTIHPLIGEVLEGEFVPPTDPTRKHRLGRLLVASYQKGDITEDSGKGSIVKQYAPSWASHVIARSAWLKDGDHAVFQNLSLIGSRSFSYSHASGLSIYNYMESEGQIRYFGPQGSCEFDLGLVVDLDAVREHITAGAQQFFDSPTTLKR